MSRFLTTRNDNVIALAAGNRPGRKQLVEHLFTQHDRALRRFLRGRAVPPEETEDLAQELFARLMCAKGLEEKMSARTGSNRAYLLSMANGLIVDHQRRKRRRKAYAEAQRALKDDRMDERTPERIVAAQLELEALKGVLMAMPLNWRVALVLKRFRNMSYEDIALHMGVTARQVEYFLRRGMRRIRKARRKIAAAGERTC